MSTLKPFAVLRFVCVLGLLAPSQAILAEESTYVGEQTCVACHGQENRHFSNTLHSKVFRLNPKNEREKKVCEACHGPGSEHAKNPKDKSLLIGFTKGWGTPIDTQNGQCMACHKGGSQLHWPGSIHADSKLGCADCHNPMEKNSATTRSKSR